MRTKMLTGVFSSLMLVSALLVSGCASSDMKSKDDSMKTMDKPMMNDSGNEMKDGKDMKDMDMKDDNMHKDMNNTM